ncbi:MAG: AAA family ATPase [Flavobacteriales bacterium]|nr:AAA family ATPase [Flavobacteriales bacterium]
MRHALVHAPTAGQERAIEALSRLDATGRQRVALILKGYAGTGKTTLLGALVEAMRQEGRPVVLLAPTGRAAKVLAAHARQEASTIHRRIYRVGGDDEGYTLGLAPNKDGGALFIVDEASMIGGSSAEEGFGARDLLGDLLEHVYMAPGCKLVLVGDPAQLPPVGSALSPALSAKELRSYGLLAGSVELTEVVRQAKASGILSNATALRSLLAAASPPTEQAGARPMAPLPRFVPQSDVIRTDGHDLQEALEDAYARDGDDEVCVVCRSNKRAYLYNQQVRLRIHGYEEELSPGDRLMVVKNNYLWAGLNGKPELIANGEPVTLKRMHRSEERYGLRFADLTVSWWSGNEERELEVKVFLDTLAAETPALPPARMKQLGQSIRDGLEGMPRRELVKRLREDPFLNALQVKYAYAVTCHKAQGGQWRTVFVDQGYLTEDMVDQEYLRWLYTAVTRATRKLHLLNFHPRFWGDQD